MKIKRSIQSENFKSFYDNLDRILAEMKLYTEFDKQAEGNHQKTAAKLDGLSFTKDRTSCRKNRYIAPDRGAALAFIKYLKENGYTEIKRNDGGMDNIKFARISVSKSGRKLHASVFEIVKYQGTDTYRVTVCLNVKILKTWAKPFTLYSVVDNIHRVTGVY